jgi:phage tail sheath protein FI
MPEQFLHGVEVVQIDSGIRPINTAKSSVIGLVGTAPDASSDHPMNEPILIAGPTHAAKLGSNGTLLDAYNAIYAQGANTVVIIRVAEGVDDAATLANVVGDPSAGTGVWALEHARARLDLTARILIAPGFTSGLPSAGVNPVVSSLISIAERTRAVVIKDGPNTTEADAKLDRANYGSDRLYIVDPAVTVFDTTAADDVTRPASAYVAGLFAKRDLEKGFWWSASNQVINGITGTTRPVGFHLSSTETEANRMNEAQVATIIRDRGFRLWGNRGAGADAQWAFLSVRRTADVIYESIERTHLWAVARPMSAQLFQDVRDSVQGFGQNLVNQGALLGFNCWLDQELNTEATLKSGKLYLDFDFEPPAPLEHLIFRAHRNDDYYEELIQSVSSTA